MGLSQQKCYIVSVIGNPLEILLVNTFMGKLEHIGAAGPDVESCTPEAATLDQSRGQEMTSHGSRREANQG